MNEYDMEYKNRTSAKAQLLAKFLAELQPSSTKVDSNNRVWKLNVDGSSSKQGSRVGISLVTPTGEVIEQSFRIGFPASNNESEDEALLAGLCLANKVGAREIIAYSDSQLIVNQYKGEYEVKDSRMEANLKLVKESAK